MSFDSLIDKIVEKQNPTVVGLDPKLDYIPNFILEKAYQAYGETFEAAASAIFEFNKGLIDALYDIVPAVKPQAAYYEMYGWQGVKALHATMAYAASRGMYVICDGKRNDIGPTMEAYARAYLGGTAVGSKKIRAFMADALTVNGYLGSDGIAPLLDCCRENDKGIFVLVKTSNPSSGEFQDQHLGDKMVYERMAEMTEKWGSQLIGKYGYSAVGAVVGATYPLQLKELRSVLPETFFLVPGYGTQGGNARDIANAFDKRGLGAIVNSSRAVMCAYKNQNRDEKEYADAARNEAVRMRDEIMESLKKIIIK